MKTKHIQLLAAVAVGAWAVSQLDMFSGLRNRIAWFMVPGQNTPFD